MHCFLSHYSYQFRYTDCQLEIESRRYAQRTLNISIQEARTMDKKKKRRNVSQIRFGVSGYLQLSFHILPELTPSKSTVCGRDHYRERFSVLMTISNPNSTTTFDTFTFMRRLHSQRLLSVSRLSLTTAWPFACFQLHTELYKTQGKKT